MRHLVCLLVLLAGQAAAHAAPADVGKIALRGMFHKDHYLGEYREEKTQAIVLVFVNDTCPVVQQYVPRLKELYTQYRERGVTLLAVYSSPGDHVMQMADHAERQNLPFRILLDYTQQLAQTLEVKRLSEVVVLDREFHVIYQGAIDDRLHAGGAKPKASQHYLRDALEAHLAGKPVALARTASQGCLLQRKRPFEADPSVTFHKDIQPLLQKRCQSCHRPGEVGPFPLLTYEDAADYAEMMLETVVHRRMPPWPATSPRKFAEDERMTEEEIKLLQHWVHGGLKRGNPQDAPAPVQWPDSGEWKIGKPDVVYEMDHPVTVPATGLLEYQYFRLPNNAQRDRWIKAVEVKPGAPSVVHHVQVHESEKGSGPVSTLEILALYGLSTQSAKLVGNYTPGNNDNSRDYGPFGQLLKANTDLIMEMHYTPNGRATTDRSKVGFIFSDQPPQRELKSRFFFKTRGRFSIPAGEEHHEMTDVYYFEKDVRVLGIRPHLHARGKNYRLEMIHTAEQDRAELVLSIPTWDFNWQRTYHFEEPLVLKAGDELRATARWDNSRHNPSNPDPTMDVPWGEQTSQEMFNTLIMYEELDSPNAARDKQAEAPRK